MSTRYASRLIFVGLAILALVVFVLGWFIAFAQPVSADYLSVTFDGDTRLDFENLTFDTQFAPSAIQVGEITTLQLTLVNRGSDPASPLIEIEIPDQFQLAVNELRGGATFNFQTRTLTWQPVIAGGDTLLTTAVPLTALRANPSEPEVNLPVTITHLGQVRRVETQIWVGEAPVGEIILNPARVSVGQPIQLQADIQGSGPIQQVWLLGDGRVVPATDPEVVYPQVGTYTVELQVVNPLGTHRAQAVLVVGPEPAAFFRPSDTTPAIGQEVRFESQAGGLPPLQHRWDFGDGTTSTVVNPTHRYAQPGTYDVILTVNNDEGQAQNFVQITVGSPPIADAVIPEFVEAGQAMSGQAFTDADDVSVVWDLGDGTTIAGERVEYTYPAGGDYIVTVNASNPFGNTTISRIVRVNGGAFYIYLPMILSEDGTAVVLPVATAQEEDLLAQTVELIENDSEVVLVANPEISTWTPQQQMLWYINEARSQAGLNPVILKDELSRAAKIHTDDMATAMFTDHTGSDGSAPYERIARTFYREGGYAGEATAWGFVDPIDAVDFWLNSPPHRAILLNPLADHVGVAQTTNYNAPSIWYWTAEFASSRGSIEAQMQEAGIRLTGPAIDASFAFTDTAVLSWVWPLPLEPSQSFGVYVGRTADQLSRVGSIRESVRDERPFDYGYPVSLTEFGQVAGSYVWQVQLESGSNRFSSSEARPIEAVGRFPTPTPPPTAVPPTALPTSQPLPATSTPVFNPTSPPPTAEPLVTQDTASATPTSEATETATVAPADTPTPLPTVTPAPTNTPTLTPTPSPTPFLLPTTETGS